MSAIYHRSDQYYSIADTHDSLMASQIALLEPLSTYPLLFSRDRRIFRILDKTFEVIKVKCQEPFIFGQIRITNKVNENLKNYINELSKIEIPFLRAHGQEQKIDAHRQIWDLVQELAKRQTQISIILEENQLKIDCTDNTPIIEQSNFERLTNIFQLQLEKRGEIINAEENNYKELIKRVSQQNQILKKQNQVYQKMFQLSSSCPQSVNERKTEREQKLQTEIAILKAQLQFQQQFIEKQSLQSKKYSLSERSNYEFYFTHQTLLAKEFEQRRQKNKKKQMESKKREIHFRILLQQLSNHLKTLDNKVLKHYRENYLLKLQEQKKDDKQRLVKIINQLSSFLNQLEVSPQVQQQLKAMKINPHSFLEKKWKLQSQLERAYKHFQEEAAFVQARYALLQQALNQCLQKQELTIELLLDSAAQLTKFLGEISLQGLRMKQF